MRRLLRIGKWTIRALFAVVALAVLSFWTLTRTEWGQTRTLNYLNGLIDGRIRGTISFDAVHAPDLLAGATLVGLRIDDAEGRRVLTTDSVRVDYALVSLLGPDLQFDALTVWGGRVRVERSASDSVTNIQTLLPPGDSTSEGPGRRISVSGVRWFEGAVEVALPLEPDADTSAILTEVDESGATRRLIRVDGLRLHGTDLVVSGRDPDEPLIDIAGLLAQVTMRDRPFHILELHGPLLLTDSAVALPAAEFALPFTRGSGMLAYEGREGEAGTLRGDLALEVFDLADLEPLSGELPDVSGRARLRLELQDWLRLLAFDEAEVEWEGGVVSGSGVVQFPAREPVFSQTSLRLARLPLEPLLSDRAPDLALRGIIGGPLELNGALDDLDVQGRITLTSPDAPGPVVAALEGRVDISDGFRAEGLDVTLDPFHFELVGALAPAFRLVGPGRVELVADGAWESGLLFDATITHRPPEYPTSIVMLNGLVRPAEAAGDVRIVGGRMTAQPLATSALRDAWPEIPLRGILQGRVNAEGLLSDLSFESDWQTVGGALELSGRANFLDIGSAYDLAATVSGFDLSRAFVNAPDSTVVSGTFEVEGSGLTLEELVGDLSVDLTGASVRRLGVPTATLRARAESGRLLVDSLHAQTEVGRVTGSGALALTEDDPSGTLELAFAADSLSRFRRLLFGDSLLARDELDPFEADLLRFEGIDPDTLPLAESFRIEGAVTGTATLSGSLAEFTAAIQAELDAPAYQTNSAASAVVDVTLGGLPTWPPSIAGSLEADSLELDGRQLVRGELEGEYAGSTGSYRFAIRRDATQSYTSQGDFEVDSAGGSVQIEMLELELPSDRWTLGAPAVASWGDRGVEVQDLILNGSGADPVRIRADGAIPVRGEADLSVEVERLPLGRVVDILQLPDSVAGHASLSMLVRGTRSAPLVQGEFALDSLRYAEFDVDRVSGTLDYAQESATIDLTTVLQGRPVLTAVGSVPLDLALDGVQSRFPDRPMDVRVELDSLPTAVPLAYFEGFSQIAGSVSGSALLRGTWGSLAPEGTFTLRDGGVRIEALGVRYAGIEGTFELNPDGTLAVDVTQETDGSANVRGTIDLQNEASRNEGFDPAFDLTVTHDGFLGVDRRDLSARITGEVQLAGSYQGPRVTGTVTVEEGYLDTEELVRSSEVVDLSDPGFFDLIRDTTFAGGARFVDLAPSPFLQKLRAQVELRLDRGFSLQSREMYLELEGTLQANWDRVQGDLSLSGALETVRGTYTTLEKPFTVQSGTVQFTGVPGIDPRLDVTAVHALRLPDRTPLNVIARLEGTLQDPRVRLTTDEEGGIAQADLISYLIFGRPTYQLTQNQNAQVQGALGGFVGAAFGAGASLATSALVTQLGAAAARDLGVDYFSVSQEQVTGFNSDVLGSTVASTLVELGFYLEQDIFLSVLLRPLVSVGSASQSEFAGVNAEWTLTPTWTLQLFYEDRFTRGRISGFGTGGVQLDKQGGLFLFRSWGY